jgi:peptidoglycan/LPS O-acetylase OafA/YrhL
MPKSVMSSSYSPNYRPDLDGLRGLCLIILVFAHAFQIHGAYLAVDVFFLISGYLMTLIITKGLEKENFSFGHFYIRRMRRILPAFVVALASIMVVALFSFYPEELRMHLSDTFASALMFSNWQFLYEDSHYFEFSSYFRPLMHVWSLSIEEQFYLFIPAFLWILWRLRINILLGLGLLLITSMLLYISSGGPGIYRYWATHLRIWELSAGGLLALFQFPRKKKEITSIIGFSCLLCGFLFLSDWVSIWGKVVALTGAMFLLGPSQGSIINSRILSNTLLVGAGKASFSIYLWHWPILVIARILHAEDFGTLSLIFLILLAFFVGGISWKFIEVPNRKKEIWLPWLLAIVVLAGCSKMALLYGFAGFYKIPADENIYPSRKCSADPEISALGENVVCKMPQSRPPEILLIGDSHAVDKYSGLSTLDPDRWEILAFGGCAPIIGIEDIENTFCPRRMANLFKFAKEARGIKTLVFGYNGNFHRLGRLKNEGPGGRNQTDLFVEGIRNALKELSSTDKRIIFLLDIPEIQVYQWDCYRKSRSCHIPQKNLSINPLYERIKQMVQKDFPEVSLFDPLAVFCQNGMCHFIEDGMPLYRDRNHLSVKGSKFYAREFLRKFPLK